MNIEEKLDWILNKVKTDKIDGVKQMALTDELYSRPKPASNDDIEAQHEWMQLTNILFDKDKLIEENVLGDWVLTVKGKYFKGYVYNKKHNAILKIRKYLWEVFKSLIIPVLVGVILYFLLKK